MKDLISLTKKHEEYLAFRNKSKGLSVDLKLIKNIKSLKKTQKLKSFDFSTLQRVIGANQLFDDIVSYEQFIKDEYGKILKELETMKKKLFLKWVEVYEPTFMTIPSFILMINSYQEPLNNELISFGINENLDIFEAETFNDLVKVRLKPGNPIKISKQAMQNLPYSYIDKILDDKNNYLDHLVFQFSSYSDYKKESFEDTDFVGYNPTTNKFYNGYLAYEQKERT